MAPQEKAKGYSRTTGLRVQPRRWDVVCSSFGGAREGLVDESCRTRMCRLRQSLRFWCWCWLDVVLFGGCGCGSFSRVASMIATRRQRP